MWKQCKGVKSHKVPTHFLQISQPNNHSYAVTYQSQIIWENRQITKTGKAYLKQETLPNIDAYGPQVLMNDFPLYMPWVPVVQPC